MDFLEIIQETSRRRQFNPKKRVGTPSPSQLSWQTQTSSNAVRSQSMDSFLQRQRNDAQIGKVPLFIEEMPFNRHIFPPVVSVHIDGKELCAIIQTASHVSLIGKKVVFKLGLSKQMQPDTLPPSPLITNWGPNYTVEGKLPHSEIAIKDIKYIVQLYVAQETQADVVLGTDFLKKNQGIVDFEASCLFLKGSRVPFLTRKEVISRRLDTSIRATSSNF